MRQVSFYHRETGMLARQRMTFETDDDDKHVIDNTPQDHVAIKGHYDPLSQRVDVATGQVVDYQPPQPSPDHAWDETTRRWNLNADVQRKADARRAALLQIATLERSQHRTMRELALGMDGAKERLQAIEDQIVAQRAKF